MQKETAIAYLKEILRINSVEGEAEEGKPFGAGVYECLCKTLSILKQEGFTVKNGDGYYGYGEIGEGELFGVLCHLDVVPVGKGWTKDPFGAEEKDGKIYARGAMDDKAPFIACLYALGRLRDEGYVPTRRVRLIVGCDEESGWKCMDEYVKKEEMPVLGFSPDGDFPVINCEKGIVYHDIGYPKPKTIEYLRAGERANMVPDEAEAKVVKSDRLLRALREKGTCAWAEEEEYLTIRAKGKAAHGSRPEEGENALIKLLDVLAEEYDGLREVYAAFRDSDGRGAGLRIRDEESGALTLNLGTARTCDEIVFSLDVRHPVTYTKEYVTEKLRETLTGRVEETFFHLPLYVEKGHPLVKRLLDAYEKVTGEKAEPIAIGGGTYARVLPCGVAFGPCFPGGNAGIHCADEFVDLSEFEKMSEVYHEAFKNLCFDKKA